MFSKMITDLAGKHGLALEYIEAEDMTVDNEVSILTMEGLPTQYHIQAGNRYYIAYKIDGSTFSQAPERTNLKAALLDVIKWVEG